MLDLLREASEGTDADGYVIPVQAAGPQCWAAQMPDSSHTQPPIPPYPKYPKYGFRVPDPVRKCTSLFVSLDSKPDRHHGSLRGLHHVTQYSIFRCLSF